MPSQFEERYAKLNTAQKQAVDTIDGPVLVVAGPGSGKTELLSLRLAHILKVTDANPSNILCLTFTDSAAHTMRQRLIALIGSEAYRVPIHTFHSFAGEIISKYPEYFYQGAQFSPLDTVGQYEIMERLIANLDYTSPLRSSHPDQGFVYLKDILEAIENIKKAGLSPEEFTQFTHNNAEVLTQLNAEIEPLFGERVSKKIIPSLHHYLNQHRPPTTSFSLFPEYSQVLWESLEFAVETAVREDSTSPLTDWKNEWLRKGSQGKYYLKDLLNIPKQESLAALYQSYQEALYVAGRFDFSDMILRVIEVGEKNEILRAELQEKYQYLLIDEFQDTNDAQMRLVHIIASAPVNEGRPNILAVGDDDQGIFRFQGAELSHILHFQEMYRNPEIIVLQENYRSRQAILDVARSVIIKGTDRLENRIPGLTKLLTAGNPTLPAEHISYVQTETIEHEHAWISQKIKEYLRKGTPPSEIAVISRTHKELQALRVQLENDGIPLQYERQQNVLLLKPIQQLITFARVLVSLNRAHTTENEAALAELLSYPFWQIPTRDLWQLAIKAHQHHKSWLTCLEEDSRFHSIATLILQLSRAAVHEPLDRVLSAMIGLIPVPSEDESSEPTELLLPRSPFREYYFNEDAYQTHPEEYIRFLSGVKTFVHTVREFQGREITRLEDLLTLVDLYSGNNLSLTDTSSFISAENAITLLTAHRAKGQEYGVVFIASCQDSIWMRKGRGNRLSFPQNFPVSHDSESEDDELRLFYVALTRAKHDLILSSYRKDTKGGDSEPLRFLTYTSLEAHREVPDTPLPEIITGDWLSFPQPHLEADSKALLKPLVENYKLSVTHLYDFLDIRNGGPQQFIEKNILYFPQPKTAAASYGIAMHETLQFLGTQCKKSTTCPKLEEAISYFERRLKREGLTEMEWRIFLQRGKDSLTAFYPHISSVLHSSDLIELNFNTQQVTLKDTELTGKIDRVVKTGSHTLEVHDYKTGRCFTRWSGGDVTDKILQHKYKLQLYFYKLLLEHSRDYGQHFQVSQGVLDFIEPHEEEIITLPLLLTPEETLRTAQLAQRVYYKIKQLEFPDTSSYSGDLAGILQFEEDLLSQKI